MAMGVHVMSGYGYECHSYGLVCMYVCMSNINTYTSHYRILRWACQAPIALKIHLVYSGRAPVALQVGGLALSIGPPRLMDGKHAHDHQPLSLFKFQRLCECPLSVLPWRHCAGGGSSGSPPPGGGVPMAGDFCQPCLRPPPFPLSQLRTHLSASCPHHHRDG
jgi:hypothetical protein